MDAAPLIDDEQMRNLMDMVVEAERMLVAGASVRNTSTILGIPHVMVSDLSKELNLHRQSTKTNTQSKRKARKSQRAARRLNRK